jgi:hypothetical protein
VSTVLQQMAAGPSQCNISLQIAVVSGTLVSDLSKKLNVDVILCIFSEIFPVRLL